LQGLRVLPSDFATLSTSGVLPVKGDLPVGLWSGAPVDDCEAVLLAAHFFRMDLAWTDCFFDFTMLVYSVFSNPK